MWDAVGDDSGEFFMNLEAQQDFWDFGFHKATSQSWFDVSIHLIDLQYARLGLSP